jgi:3D (Asp-Asp-Asp) domain-containing protein
LVPLSYDSELVVTATAYNSLVHQTDADPDIAAWGDRLEPGMRSIAVSRDLLQLGLTRGTRVRIDGVPGEFVVLDKMARRFKKRIDIYMGVDEEYALEWGRKKVRIFWSSAK